MRLKSKERYLKNYISAWLNTFYMLLAVVAMATDQSQTVSIPELFRCHTIIMVNFN